MKPIYLFGVVAGIVVIAFGHITDPIPTPPPWFPAMTIPDDNALTPERWALGKRLFFDKALSKDSTLACASCHNPAFAFADTVAFSLGIGHKIGTRNAPTLANIGYAPYFHADGSHATLEMQVHGPIENEAEFNDNLNAVSERLAADQTYQRQSQAAYQNILNPDIIARALSCYERTILSGYARFDRYQQEEDYTLNDAEMRGKDLFFSAELGCARCHFGKFFTDFGFYNVGLYTDYADKGLSNITKDEADIGKFKTPTLRNIAITAPYMHDGSMQTLEQVMQHYATNGKNHPNRSHKMTQFNITSEQKTDVIAFLQTLTDTAFLSNPALSN